MEDTEDSKSWHILELAIEVVLGAGVGLKVRIVPAEGVFLESSSRSWGPVGRESALPESALAAAVTSPRDSFRSLISARLAS